MVKAAYRPSGSSIGGSTDRNELHDVACRELAEVCGVINAGHGQMVRLMADVLADDAWTGAGILSPHHWLTWKTSLSRQAASAVINLAKRSGELGATVAALCEGRISLESAGLIARYVPAEYEHSALELSEVATVSQLRRSVSRYYFDIEKPEREPEPAPEPPSAAPDPPSSSSSGSDEGLGGPDDEDKAPTPTGDDGAGEPEGEGADRGGSATSDGGAGAGPGASGSGDRCCHRHEPTGMQGGRYVWPSGRPIEERRDLTMGDGENGWYASIHLPEDLAAVFEGAVRARRDDLYRAAEKGLGPSDPRPRVTLVDALMSIMEGSLEEASAKRPGTDRYLIHAHLTGAPGGGNSLQLHLGATLPHHLRRLYTCDGNIRPVLETDGISVNIGRLHRIVSRRVRRLIEHRDGGCAVPGCGKRHALEVHHIWHWEDGGLTTTDNLLTLCRFHHRLHHLGHLRIWGDADGPRYTPDGVQFADASGRPLLPVGVAVCPAAGESLEKSARNVGLDPVGFESALGERVDYSQVFFSRRRPAPPGTPTRPPAPPPGGSPGSGDPPSSGPPDADRPPSGSSARNPGSNGRPAGGLPGADDDRSRLDPPAA